MNYYRVLVDNHSQGKLFRFSGDLEPGARVVVSYHDPKKMKSIQHYAADLSKAKGTVLDRLTAEEVNKEGLNPKCLMRIEGLLE